MFHTNNHYCKVYLLLELREGGAGATKDTHLHAPRQLERQQPVGNLKHTFTPPVLGKSYYHQWEFIYHGSLVTNN